GRIPIAALAGMLLAVALRMLHPRELMALWKASRVEAGVYLVTFAVIVLVDLIVGVQAGIVAALVIAAVRMGGTKTSHLELETPGPYRFVLSGSISFMSSSKLERLRVQAGELESSRGFIVDLSGVTNMDTSGAELFVEWVEGLRARGARVALVGLGPELQRLLAHQHGGEALLALQALSEADAVLSPEGQTPASSRERLAHGVERFRQQQWHRYGPLFNRLAEGQKPHTLFITCADSRINPNLITSTDPGELFVVRNVGNLVPCADSPVAASVGSAIEYAVGVLGVTDVVVCGHSGCGAMQVLLGNEVPPQMQGVRGWLDEARPLLSQLSEGSTPEEAARLNARMQLDNALTWPLLREKVQSGEVRLHAWFYDMGRAELLEWDAESGEYLQLGKEPQPRPASPLVPGLPEGAQPTEKHLLS
ncbi:MAG TPA: carbonic anhydrase, partial [Myxococcaceae bacterium]|nr:carbonic anhydrase [Myxococcaceae bacterium]